jgi:site-specific DNA recombinase
MARKSRKENNMAINEMICYAVGYIRLSVANKDEACSVANQKLIVEQWAAHQEIVIERFYIDENYSGSSFKRPAFQEMLSDIDDRKIGCVIVKDLSRLGREFISTCYYIEEYFPSRKVRFVSVNDQFDTIDGINNRIGSSPSRIRIPLTNAFNEQVSLDISRKTQAVLDTKAQRGMFIGPRAPYGYRKSDENRFMIEPDRDAADVIKKIFGMAADGTGINAIVRYLNEQTVPTPIQYARAKGLEGNYNDGDGVWNTRSVKYILTNRTYIGVLIQGKEKCIVKGSHTPLVDSKTFNSIQSMLREKAFNVSAKDIGLTTENILKGKVICGCCGSKMQRRRGTNHANWYFFTCLTNNRVGADRCTGMYVREDDIFGAIYHQIKLWIGENFIATADYEAKRAMLQQEITELREFSINTAESLCPYYEQFISKQISRNEFDASAARIRGSKVRVNIAQKELDEYEHQYQEFKKMCKARDKERSLSEVIDNIEKITIYGGRRVEVLWRR